MPKTPFNVFYSWESDLPECTNLLLIRSALKDAENALTNDADLDKYVTIDEATSNRAGSPNIADSIFKKVRAADVFVCDMSTVLEQKKKDGGARKSCNPNVAIELGYAIRVLGWDRIIMIVNEAYGKVEDLPFDVRGHRTTKYTCKADLDDKLKPTQSCKEKIANARGALKTTLVAALRHIAESEPRRPQESEEKSTDEIRRERDVKQLSEVLRQVPPRVLDHYLERLSFCSIPIIGTEFFERLEATIYTHDYHLNNAKLNDLVLAVYQRWKDTLKHDQEMDLRPNGKELFFRMPGDVPTSLEQGKFARDLPKTAGPLNEALVAFFAYVRKNYVEVDIDALQTETLERHRANQRRIERLFASPKPKKKPRLKQGRQRAGGTKPRRG